MTTVGLNSGFKLQHSPCRTFSWQMGIFVEFFSSIALFPPVNCSTFFPSGIIKSTLTFDLDLTLGEPSDDREHLSLVDFSV